MSINGRLKIPTDLIVGFSNRKDTYTGKLSYVTYYKEDKKNNKVIAKETSWVRWRDSNIEPLEIENIPTEGFVLNKHVGGCKSGWNFRQSYCRIYDPRDFEFEITMENLLYILDYCDCIKGKGLIGKFVYAWDGPNLVLLPVSTPEYQESLELKKNIEKGKPTNKTIKVGSLYKDKKENNLVYIGRYSYREYLYKRFVPIKKMFIFYDVDKMVYKAYSTLSPIDYIVTEDYYKPHEMTDVIENYLNSFEGYDKKKKFVNLMLLPTNETIGEYIDRIIQENPDRNTINIFLMDGSNENILIYRYYRYSKGSFEFHSEEKEIMVKKMSIDRETILKEGIYYVYSPSDAWKRDDVRYIPFALFDDGKQIQLSEDFFID